MVLILIMFSVTQSDHIVHSIRVQPNEELKLTANSLGAHIETHRKLILRTLIYLTVNSQDDSHCELVMSFPRVCNSHREFAVSKS